MSVEFRAVFNDPDDTTQERPIQILSSTRKEADEWAAKVLAAGGPNSFVSFYETSERYVGFMRKRQEPKP